MSFLDDFDKRAAHKPGDPVPQGDTPEERELLEFADLIRSRRAVPEDGERQRVLDRVKGAQNSPAPKVIQGGGSFRGVWLALAAAAIIALVVGLSQVSAPKNVDKVAINDGSKPTPIVNPLSVEVTKKAQKLVASSKPIGSNRAPNEEFANLDFPKPQIKEGDASAVESKSGLESARLVRVQGLAMFQKKGETRWRVANRGQIFNAGDVIRASKRLESCVRILGPDGSAVSLATNGVLRYDGPRNWALNEGSAYFEVASRKDLPLFTVATPHGSATAKGTIFSLDAGKGAADPASTTLCWVEDGKVAVAARDKNAVDVDAGKSALLERDAVKLQDVRYSKDWLAALERAAENDHGIGQLVAKSEKANEHLPLEVKSHSVSVTVVDQVARTFVDEVFINNTDRRLEGTFYYPLPADASISEFAMYVGDQRIVGEVLEQQRARQIFEYIVRQQRDPALLEYAGGNLFKMRVFPIEPHSEKRIQLGYTQILPRSNGKVTYTYPLYSEMLLKNPLLDLKIEFRAISTPGLNNLASPTHTAPSAMSEDMKRGALAFRAKNYSPTRDFSVTYDVPDGAECVAFANLRPDDTQGYFMVQLCPKTQLPQREPPQRLLVVVDGSASAGAQDYAVASEFAASAADVSGNWQFGIVRGGQKPKALGAMAFADPNTSTNVRDFLKKSPPLGATDLLETFRQAASMVTNNEGLQLVYVGDGIDTVSELSGPALVNEIAALFKGKGVKVSTVATGSSYDGAVLKGIAAKLGGTFTRVEGASDVHAAVGQVFDSFYRPMLWDMMVNFEEIEVSGVYPEFVGTLAAGDTAVVLGRFNREKNVKGRVSVFADIGGTMAERKYDINLSADETSNRFLPRLWAKAHIDAQLGLMGLGSANDDARTKQGIIETSINFQIMSPFTAFLVLESEDDYKRFGIKRTMKKWDWNGDASGLQANKERALKSLPEPMTAAPSGANANWANDFGDVASATEGLTDLGLDLDEGNLGEDKSGGLREVEKLSKAQEDVTVLRAAKDGEVAFDTPELLEEAQNAQEGDRFESLEREDDSRSFKRVKTELSAAAAAPARFLGYLSDDAKSNYRSRGLGRRGYYNQYSQFNSLVFHSGTVVEIEVDQPLRPVSHYQRVTLSGKGSLATQLNLCLALESLGRFEDALKALAPVIEKAPTNVDLRLEEGSLRYRSNDVAGGKAAFAKALELTPDKDRAAINERIAGLLGSLGQYADAAESYAAFARSSEKVELATQRAQMAANHYVNAGQTEKAWPLWEEMLKRWPDDANLSGAAGVFAANSGKFERGLELVRAARKRDPKVNADLINAFIQRGKREEALAEYREILAGNDSNRIYTALAALNSLGQNVALDEAMKLLGEKHTAAEISGAVQYLQSYNAVHTKAGAEAVQALLQRPELLPQARISVFYLLHAIRNNNVVVKVDGLAILGAMIENPQTQEQWGFAQQALHALSSYGHQKEALEAVQKLMQRKDIPENVPASLAQIECNALNGLGRYKEADEKTLKLVDEAKDEYTAYSPAWQTFHARLNRNELEGASQIVDRFAKRFPESQYLPQFYSYLIQRLRQNEKESDAAALLEKISKANPENAVYIDLRARMLASKGKFRDAASIVREGIEILARPLPEIPQENFEKTQVEPNEAIQKEQQKKIDAAKAKVKERTQLMQRYKSQRENLISLLAQLSAQDAELRNVFMKECVEKAKSEDPGEREWTEAELTALNASADVEGYIKRLQALANAEPNDPIWSRRLGTALASHKKLAEARVVLGKISDEQKEDIELALGLADMSARLKDAVGTEKYFQRAFDALVKQPQRMQQFASQWQQTKPEWAVKAWKHLLEKDPAQAAYAAYSLATVYQQMGKLKEAAEINFRCMTMNESSYAQSAMNNLVSLCQNEEQLRPTLAQANKSLETADGKKSVYMNLLVYQLEKIRNDPSSRANAQKALDAAAAIDLPPHDYSAGSYVINILVQDNQFDRAEKYALEGGGKINQDTRRNLIRHAAGSAFTSDKERKRGIKLYKMLVESPDQNLESDQSQLSNLLIQDNQFASAEDIARKMPATRNSWTVYNAWNNVIQAYQRTQQFARAADLALEAWQTLRDDPSYGENMFSQFISVCDGAIQNKANLKPETVKLAADRIRESSKAYFEGEAQRSSWIYSSNITTDRLGLRKDIEAFAKEAGASDDPKRVQLAAEYYRANGRWYDEARRLYKRALTLPGADEHTINPQLYQLLAHQNGNQQPLWGDAIELLEKLKAAKQFDENTYLVERGRCLYGLNRREEARAEYRKVMARPAYWRQGYWQFQSLAYQFQQNKDWQMAAEAWELAIRLMRTQSRGQIDGGTAAQFYQGCAQAYLELGDKDKALDSFLRGMSMVPRNNSYYQQILDAALKHVLNGATLDKTVEEYEKSVAASGGGEKPHLRIAFADGYRKANDQRKMLKQLSVAADLLPKDTQLRQQVIEGYKGLNDTEAVIAAYSDWAKFDSQNIEIYRGLGDFYESKGRREDALLAWATMAEIRPREAEGYRAYSQKLAQIGVHDKAAVALRHALRYRPTEFDISKELSAEYTTLKQSEKIAALWTTGETACRKAIEDFADDPLPWLNLGRFLGAQNRAKDEQDLYREILRKPWPRFQRETYDEANKRLAAAK
jgi:tetratricopeptide (TPR) repeat protein